MQEVILCFVQMFGMLFKLTFSFILIALPFVLAYKVIKFLLRFL